MGVGYLLEPDLLKVRVFSFGDVPVYVGKEVNELKKVMLNNYAEVAMMFWSLIQLLKYAARTIMKVLKKVQWPTRMK